MHWKYWLLGIVAMVLPQADSAAKEQVELSLVVGLIPLAADGYLAVRVSGGAVSLERNENVVLLTRASGSQLKRIEKILAEATAETWSGFYVYRPAIDGHMVAFSAIVDGNKFTFSGGNGGPVGFGELLVVLDEILGKKVFDGEHWREQCAESEQFETLEVFYLSLEEEAVRRIEEEAKRRKEDDSSEHESEASSE